MLLPQQALVTSAIKRSAKRGAACYHDMEGGEFKRLHETVSLNVPCNIALTESDATAGDRLALW